MSLDPNITSEADDEPEGFHPDIFHTEKLKLADAMNGKKPRQVATCCLVLEVRYGSHRSKGLLADSKENNGMMSCLHFSG